MNRKVAADYLAYQDDEYLNRLATDWYFLDMFFNSAKSGYVERVIDPLIEVGMRLKRCLHEAGTTYLTPRKICAYENLYFDIWLDADGDIQAGNLYLDEQEDTDY